MATEVAFQCLKYCANEGALPLYSVGVCLDPRSCRERRRQNPLWQMTVEPSISLGNSRVEKSKDSTKRSLDFETEP